MKRSLLSHNRFLLLRAAAAALSHHAALPLISCQKPPVARASSSSSYSRASLSVLNNTHCACPPVMQPSKPAVAAAGKPKKTSSIAAAADALVAAAALKDAPKRPESWSGAVGLDKKVAFVSSSALAAAASDAALHSASKTATGTEASRLSLDHARPQAERLHSRPAAASTTSPPHQQSAAAASSPPNTSPSPLSVPESAAKHIPSKISPAATGSAAAPSFMSSALYSTFADEAFDMDSFLLRAATSNSDIHSFTPANLRTSLLTVLDTVKSMETQAREELRSNEFSFAEVENIRRHEVEACENELEEMLERLRVLTSSVANIWGKSRGTADLLITADRQRTRAAEAVEIIEWFERIKEERLLTVHKEILQPGACWDFAHLVHGLAAFARDLRVSGCATAVADVQQLEELFERELLSIFDQAQEVDVKGSSADWATMKKCADTLRFLNGGTSVIQHFVCSRPCFFDVTTFERDDELIKSANSMEVAVAIVNRVFTEMYEVTAENVHIVKEVFPSEPLRVLTNLVQRLFNQRGHQVTEGVLDNVRLTGGDEALLPCLCELYDLCWAWCTKFEALVGGDVEIRYLVNEMFNKHLPEYPSRETKVLVSKCELLLPLPPHTLDELLHWHNTSRPPAPLHADVGPMQECCSLLALAVQRSTILRMNRQDRMQRPGFLVSLLGCVAARLQLHLTSGLALCTARLACKVETAVTELCHIIEFSVQATQHLNKSVAETLFTELEADVHAQNNARRTLSSYNNDLESAINEALDACLDAIMVDLSTALKDQKRLDYNPKASQKSNDGSPSLPFAALVDIVRRRVQPLQQSLVGPNKIGALTSVGARLYVLLLQHLKRFVISMGGGLLLLNDMVAVRMMVQEWRIPAVSNLFDKLRDLVNLFVVSPDALPSMLDSPPFNKMKQGEIMLLVKQRADFETHVRHIVDWQAMSEKFAASS